MGNRGVLWKKKEIAELGVYKGNEGGGRKRLHQAFFKHKQHGGADILSPNY